MTYFPIHARIHAEYRHASGVRVIRHADYPYPPARGNVYSNIFE